MDYKRIMWLVVGVGLLLLVPLMAMQFTDEMNWDLFDFVFAGVLLMSTGLVYQFLTRKGGSPLYKMSVGAGVLVVLLVIWAEAAVGIF